MPPRRYRRQPCRRVVPVRAHRRASLDPGDPRRPPRRRILGLAQQDPLRLRPTGDAGSPRPPRRVRRQGRADDGRSRCCCRARRRPDLACPRSSATPTPTARRSRPDSASPASPSRCSAATSPSASLFGAVLFAFLNEQSNPLTLRDRRLGDVVQITQGIIVLSVVVAYEVVRRYADPARAARRWPARLDSPRRRRRRMSVATETPRRSPAARASSATTGSSVARGHRCGLGGADRHRRRRPRLDRHDPRGDHRDLPDPDGRHRRALERARRRRQHRPRGSDDPRHVGCGLLHLLLRTVDGRRRRGAAGRRSAASCTRWRR